ncbi:hypothetical protein T08_14285 [Trichinella sp. T8]|nr:hypothetical protein T08_14285 [Trichinella sp. T8]
MKHLRDLVWATNLEVKSYPYTRRSELRPTGNLTYHLFSVLLPIDRVYILLRIS